MMQNYFCSREGWISPFSGYDDKDIPPSFDHTISPLHVHHPPVCVKVFPKKRIESQGIAQLDDLDETTLLKTNHFELLQPISYTRSLKVASLSVHMTVDLPSLDDYICICQKWRNERSLTPALAVYRLACYHGLDGNRVLGNYLVPMLVDCGSVSNAQHLFDRLSYHSDCSWACLIRGYSEAGDVHHVLKIHQAIIGRGLHLTKYTFVALLTACVELKLVQKGLKIHTEVVVEGFDIDAFVGNTLINMYATFSMLAEAQDVLTSLPTRDVISWTSILSGYGEQGFLQKTITCLEQMQMEGIAPNAASYVCALKACVLCGAVAEGREIHTDIVLKGYDEDLNVANLLLDMYVKNKSLAEAKRVHDVMPVHDVVSWTTLIAGYAEYGPYEDALISIDQMQEKGVCTNTFTFVCGLKACCSMEDLKKGQSLHMNIAKIGIESDLFVGNVLIDLYGKCRLLHESKSVFNHMDDRDVVTYTALLNSFLEQGLSEDVLKYMSEMEELGVSPNLFTLVCGVKACRDLGNIAKGHELHTSIVAKGLENDIVASTILMDMYAKCDSRKEASFLFNTSHVRDTVSWSIMIGTSIEYDENENTFVQLAQMQEQGCAPDHGILVNILTACGNLGLINIGQRIHAQVYGSRMLKSNTVGALIDMYGKCGDMTAAQHVFDEVHARDLAMWSALISGYARQGDYELAFDLFDRMMSHGVQPDSVAFLNILSLCNHVGTPNRARAYFDIMTDTFGMLPSIKHCTCLVDLLGRVGQLEEAINMAEKMSLKHSSVLWKTVLSACENLRNTDLGRHSFHHLEALGERASGPYVAMANIIVDAHMWDDAKRTEWVKTCFQESKISRNWAEIGVSSCEYPFQSLEHIQASPALFEISSKCG